MSVVSIKHVESYDFDAVYSAVSAHFDTLKLADELSPSMKVVIKPNLLLGRKPDAAVTTHPNVIRAIVKKLRSLGVSDITVADSPGGLYTPAALSGVYSACGYKELEDICTVNTDCSFGEVRCREGLKTRSFNLISPIINADYIINAAKLKTHSMTGVSAGIKNLFGTIPGLQKPEMHYRNPDYDAFADMLLDLAETVKPNVTFIDAVYGMEGNGPSGGDVKYMGALFASKDIFTQDTAACTLMGIDPEAIPMLRLARERGLSDMASLEFAGDEFKPVEPAFKLPDAHSVDFTGFMPSFLRKPVKALLDKLLRPMPKLDREKCVGCGRCAESCPQHIIKIIDRKASIPKKGCISCFCCQEMCPPHAISVHRIIR